MKVRLKELFPKSAVKNESKNIIINGLSDDSRSVSKGDLFFIIERKNFDIYSILKNIEPKVAAFVSDVNSREKIKSLLKYKPVIFVRGIKEHFLKACDLFYGFDKDGFKFIGITGTNGKTTTAYLTYYLLKKLGEKSALISTVKYCTGSFRCKSSYTTPDILTLRKFFQQAAKKEADFVIMEVSSHAIDQERIKGISFSRCVFTNLTHEHLDYHKTMANYFIVKKRLFLNNKSSLAIINTDDVYGKKIFSKLSRRLSYGIKSAAMFRAEDILINKAGSKFILKINKKSYPVKTNLLGKHNILNVLAAITTVYSLGIDIKRIVKAVSSFKTVKGRLERINRDIFVDYAHTPDALERVLFTLKEVGYSKIICVFGCGGDRDKSKRPLMGKIASAQAYFTYITCDNSRSEDPKQICLEIEKGFKAKNYSVVLDRREAIFKAIKLLEQNRFDNQGKRNICLLIAGKGHENYQIIGDRKLAFDDSRVVREIIKSRNNK